MTNYFVVVETAKKPVGYVFADEPPPVKKDTTRKRLPSGDPILYGPVAIPAVLEGASLKVLMGAWRAEMRKPQKPKAAISKPETLPATLEKLCRGGSGRVCVEGCQGFGLCVWAAQKIQRQQNELLKASDR